MCIRDRITSGSSLEEALLLLERMEHISRTYAIARMLGNVRPLPEKVVKVLEETQPK